MYVVCCLLLISQFTRKESTAYIFLNGHQYLWYIFNATGVNKAWVFIVVLQH